MKEQTNYDYEKYVQIAQMAKMGWWESDLKNKEYICSDFIVDLLGLESNRISFTEFHQRIREDHRLRLKNEYMSLSYLETYEQMFPIRAKDGEIWVYLLPESRNQSLPTHQKPLHSYQTRQTVQFGS